MQINRELGIRKKELGTKNKYGRWVYDGWS
jgi:hypothetical protein